MQASGWVLKLMEYAYIRTKSITLENDVVFDTGHFLN